MALTYSTAGELGSIAPAFSLLGVDGKSYSLADFKNSKVLVVVFMCNHCPYVVATQGRVNALAKKYRPQGVSLIGINSNDSVKYPDDSYEAMKVRAKEENFIFPYLHDESQEVARAYGAVCTPEFYVYQAQAGKFILKYKGRLDDSWKDEAQVQRQDLALALDDLLSGKEPDLDQKPSMGCSIKWKI